MDSIQVGKEVKVKEDALKDDPELHFLRGKTGVVLDFWPGCAMISMVGGGGIAYVSWEDLEEVKA